MVSRGSDIKAVTMLTYFPEEIISRILSRLPVKSLLSFKCVSKTWYNLIDHPTFISMHLNRSMIVDDENDKETKSFLISHSDKTIRKHVVDMRSKETYNDFIYLNIPYDTYASVTFLGSCDGLVCVWANGDNYKGPQYFVVNPATRESRKIFPTGHHINEVKYSFGFGFDPISNDYKLVRISNIFRAEVWTLGTGIWREVGGVVKGELKEFTCSEVLNGAFHWATVRYGARKHSCAITSFDVTKETLGEMVGPNVGFSREYRLFVNKGCLAMVSSYEDEDMYTCFNVWVMNEYGDEDSWTKVHIVDNSYMMRPLGFGKTGDMLVGILTGGLLGVYEFATKQTYQLPIEVQRGQECGVLDYTETLVPVEQETEFTERFSPT